MGISHKLLGGGTIFRDSSLYPQCKIFNCARTKSVKNLCCAYCEKRITCSDKCLNDPEKCKQCVIPPNSKKEWKRMDDYDLQDAPDIARAERTGLKPGQLPFDEEEVKCPICGMICQTLYRDYDQDICGCENCLKPIDAEDYWFNERREEGD